MLHQPVKILFTLALTAILWVSCSNGVSIPAEVKAHAKSLPHKVDYNLHVKPILSDRCFKCHGPDKSKIEAGLQLATEEGATMRLESGRRAIVPGDIGRSELVRRILSTDPEEIMPVPESHLTLADEEKALLIEWVRQGAKYAGHWSLAPIKKTKVPAAGQTWLARNGWRTDAETQWVRNEIDHFALDKMKQKGLQPSPEADKTTLLRRVYMDITGLPPAPEAVEAFLNDATPDAYEKVVDSLLQSPHYGEQQTVSWLDLARYADSHGYQDDGFRNAYPYRDWVIEAFNKNLPLDQFVQQQLAGDLMPNPNKDMLIATSFLRQHQQTQEGGVVPEEYRMEYVADRTNTFGKAFLGLTMECARCHDHKYDPILTKDYYALSAFFNQNRESGIVPYIGEATPTLLLPTPKAEAMIRQVQQQIRTLEPQLQPEQFRADFEVWAKRLPANPGAALQRGLLVHLPMGDTGKIFTNTADQRYQAVRLGDSDRKPMSVAGKTGAASEFLGDCGVQIYMEGVDKIKGKDQPSKTRFAQALNFERYQEFSFSLWVNPTKDSITGSIFQRSNYDFEGWRGYAMFLNADRTLSLYINHTWPGNCIELKTEAPLALNRWQHLAMTYDGSSKAAGLRLYVDGQLAPVKVLADQLTKSILHIAKKKNWYGASLFEIGQDARRKTIDHVQIDELRIYDRCVSPLEAALLAGIPQSEAWANTADPRLLEHYTWLYDPAYAALKKHASLLRAQENALITEVPEVMVMQELPPDQVRKTHILKRGAYDAPGEVVNAATLSQLPPMPPNLPRNRLGLAQWLLDTKNPLFARVMANRVWLQLFGTGLVKTQEDFGNQGDLPSHPELLDWLAVQYREDGWDTKQFIRRIVTSTTYRQSSRASAEVIERDPENRWLARGPNYRYSAEQVRDNALAASELLVRKLGGESVYPYQPGGIWEALATRNAVVYKQQHGDSLYRRSLYTIWKRSSPPPMMLNFDVPDRSSCTVRRQKTATPLQALVALNDPQFVEAARVLAERTMRRKSSHTERLQYFFMAAISRPPRPRELELMQALYADEYAAFAKKPDRARNLLQIGEYPRDPTLDPAETAAYAIVANTILNYDEALVKR